MLKLTSLFILMFTMTGCSSVYFKPYSGVARVCTDRRDSGTCLVTMEEYDNSTIHKHDPRELEGIEVPQR